MNAVAMMPDDGIVIAGDFVGTLNLGGSTLTTGADLSNPDMFVARYTADGAHVFSSGYGSSGTRESAADVATGAGVIGVVANFAGTIQLLPYTFSSKGATDGVVAALNGTGGVVWARQIEGGGVESLVSVAIDQAGSVYAAGQHGPATQFGVGQIEQSSGAFVAKFNPTINALVWVRTFGGASAFLRGMSLSPRAEVVATGEFRGTETLGGPVLSAAAGDAFSLALSLDNGVHRSSWLVGGPADESPRAVVTMRDGSAIYVIWFGGTLTIDGQEFSSPLRAGTVLLRAVP